MWQVGFLAFEGFLFLAIASRNPGLCFKFQYNTTFGGNKTSRRNARFCIEKPLETLRVCPYLMLKMTHSQNGRKLDQKLHGSPVEMPICHARTEGCWEVTWSFCQVPHVYLPGHMI